MKLLVTGANGFVGRHLCDLLVGLGYDVTGTARSNCPGAKASNCESRVIGDIGGDVDWGPVLRDIDLVVHLAARVHVMQDQEPDPLAAFRKVNVRGTEQLLRHECMRNVKRFVYVSTVKVHGDVTSDSAFAANDVLTPEDPYAQSKLEAEQLVESVGGQSGIETVIVRPPLVYGPGVGGNFFRLLQMVDKGYPLPLGKIENLRSLVGVSNLCDLIRECLENRSAVGQRFLVSDDTDVSTPDLIRLIASALNKPARLLPIPVTMMELAARMLGRSAEVSRLTGSLQVATEDTMKTLGWTPPVSLVDGIRSTATWYREQSDNA